MPKKKSSVPIGILTKKGAYVQNKVGKFEKVKNFLTNNQARNRFFRALLEGKLLKLGKDGKLEKV